MLRVLEFSQIAKGCYFAAEQVFCDFVVNVVQVYGFDGYFMSWVSIHTAQVAVACTSFSKQRFIEDRILIIEFS